MAANRDTATGMATIPVRVRPLDPEPLKMSQRFAVCSNLRSLGFLYILLARRLDMYSYSCIIHSSAIGQMHLLMIWTIIDSTRLRDWDIEWKPRKHKLWRWNRRMNQIEVEKVLFLQTEHECETILELHTVVGSMIVQINTIFYHLIVNFCLLQYVSTEIWRISKL